MKVRLLLICHLLSFGSFTQIREISFGNIPFTFSNPRESFYFNFTIDELILLKENNIDGVNVNSCNWENKAKIKYIFDEKCYLSNIHFYNERKGEDLIVQNVRYNVDSCYNLIAKENTVIGSSVDYDSMAYDTNGRIIYKEYSHKKWSKKKKSYVLDSLCQLVLVHSDEDGVILVNKANGSKTYINNENETYRFESKNRIDSLSIQTLENDIFIKSYWFKYDSDSIFRIGLKQDFVDDLLVKETIYFAPRIGEEAYMYYVYNQDSQLTLSYLSFLHFGSPQEKQVYIYNGDRLSQYTYLGSEFSNCFDFGYWGHIILR